MRKRDIKEWVVILAVIAAGILLFWWSSQPYVKVIDGCEYIVTTHAHGTQVTHKGNCNNHEVSK